MWGPGLSNYLIMPRSSSLSACSLMSDHLGLSEARENLILALARQIRRAYFRKFSPPRPTFTLSDVPSQQGKVVIVTGGASGIGQELVRMLYEKGATVYIAGRSESHAQAAIQTIQVSTIRTTSNTTGGQLYYLPLHLDDLTTIKSTVSAFASRESRLDLLVNNAGVSQPPLGSVSAQGIELQIATNCLGPYLLTQLLLPFLTAAVTANNEFSPAPRVIWTSSQVAELSASPEGIILSELRDPPRDAVRNYVTSKLGNWFLSVEFARRYRDAGLVSVAQNPGAANTNLLRNARWMKLLSWPLLYPLGSTASRGGAGLGPAFGAGGGGRHWAGGRVLGVVRGADEGLFVMILLGTIEQSP
ncbi:NAD(P)-binding protein [Aspergillus uvarum CBS 121591]|uniref:NAD(P)-binding protein n=1 Tax=Aspergillus uvarum CBS 121591 TaxID=1448315 RepID=A0A319CKV0_9EURO|nr:NAD(P)-binding protein [Aspergillus uvarum CBS 121591]PYH86195.1 NAD(P)-binding protein [Aspergillus uvarum CBS 121591]